MEITRFNNDSHMVKFSPTEIRMLDEAAFATDRKVEAVIATLMFGALVTDHAQRKVDIKIVEHELLWTEEPLDK